MHCWRATTIGRLIYTVSQKNPAILAVTRESIVGFFIMFGTHVTEKVSNQQML